MDQLITIIIVLAVSAVATLLKKMKQGEETPNTPPLNRPRQPRPQSAPQPRPTTSWEDELRRLLGDETAPPPAPRAPSPPVVIAPPQPSPAPVIRPPSPIQPQRQPQPMPAPRPRVITAPIAPPAASPFPSRPAVARAAALAEAQQVYQQVALNQETSARVDGAAVGRIQSATVERRPASAEVIQVVALFKSARTARQAVIASIILGPPPALEPSSSYF